MCGIAGLIQTKKTDQHDVRAVERMVIGQRHRGPDDGGLYSDAHAVLGHRRLSIIDLSAAGHQPMSNEGATVWVTYNGEIYNYRELHDDLAASGHLFRSSSDTEVLVHGYEAWGIDGLLQRLRGMFAFALYDTRAGLILARDRLGIKPLYYFPRNASLMFASEVKALIASGRVPSETEKEALAGFLLAGSVPSPLTIVKGVCCLEPGHYLVWKNGAFSLHKYWDLNCQPHQGDGQAYLRPVLADTVAKHLVSDVPTGLFLSGGVDSGALVALASRAKAELKTLTVIFDEGKFSEAKEARHIAEVFGTRHIEIRVTDADFVRELPRVVECMDQPTHDGVNTYFVCLAAKQAGLKVVLSGLGGDEVFWGYKQYRWMVQRRALLSGFAALPSLARRTAIAAAVAYGRMRGRENWMRLASLSDSWGAEGVYRAVRGFFAPQQVCDLLGITESELSLIIQEHFSGSGAPVSERAPMAALFNYIEVKRYLHDQLLRDTDVFSMAHSIEARVPFLDHTVVECAAGLSQECKVSKQENKPVLVNAVGDTAVTRAATRAKRGFSFPLRIWMKQHQEDLRHLALSGGSLNPVAINRMWSAFERGRLHWSRAWALSVLGAKRAAI